MEEETILRKVRTKAGGIRVNSHVNRLFFFNPSVRGLKLWYLFKTKGPDKGLKRDKKNIFHE